MYQGRLKRLLGACLKRPATFAVEKLIYWDREVGWMVKNEANRYFVIWMDEHDLREIRREYEEAVIHLTQNLITHYARLLVGKRGGRLASRFLDYADWTRIATSLLTDCVVSWLEPEVFDDLREAYRIG